MGTSKEAKRERRVDREEVARLALAIEQLPATTWPGGYRRLDLAIIDAIWSIGANYDSHVRSVIARYTDSQPTTKGRSADLLRLIGDSPERFAPDW